MRVAIIHLLPEIHDPLQHLVPLAGIFQRVVPLAPPGDNAIRAHEHSASLADTTLACPLSIDVRPVAFAVSDDLQLHQRALQLLPPDSPLPGQQEELARRNEVNHRNLLFSWPTALAEPRMGNVVPRDRRGEVELRLEVSVLAELARVPARGALAVKVRRRIEPAHLRAGRLELGVERFQGSLNRGALRCVLRMRGVEEGRERGGVDEVLCA